jgi:hypothetical protein
VNLTILGPSSVCDVCQVRQAIVTLGAVDYCAICAPDWPRNNPAGSLSVPAAVSPPPAGRRTASPCARGVAGTDNQATGASLLGDVEAAPVVCFTY